ncbi:hypothetical protein BT96DRAFT_1003366 [Gymnopus androsaceus JB14]|uniref:Uncharacterized protein n=1 Tax=Gymnopus androsaceus JB14 TaxID=1447944 RepID=A0A6A4GW43_9AGAR|nr:hypothetical protein BT96DRAFT_1003366 [Gymnopus androsaceus JB14]
MQNTSSSTQTLNGRQCAAPNCSKPFNAKCTSLKCKTHCRASGGCRFSGHAVASPLLQTSVPVVSPFPLSTADSSQSPSLPVRQSQREVLDEARLTSKKVGSTVSIYFWYDRNVPIPLEIQGAVIDGNLTIMQDLLDRFEFSKSSFHFYKYRIRTWTAAATDHAISLNTLFKLDGVPTILLRDPAVSSCEGIDALLEQAASDTGVHASLANPASVNNRRKSLKQRLDAKELSSSLSCYPNSLNQGYNLKLEIYQK